MGLGFRYWNFSLRIRSFQMAWACSSVPLNGLSVPRDLRYASFVMLDIIHLDTGGPAPAQSNSLLSIQRPTSLGLLLASMALMARAFTGLWSFEGVPDRQNRFGRRVLRSEMPSVTNDLASRLHQAIILSSERHATIEIIPSGAAHNEGFIVLSPKYSQCVFRRETRERRRRSEYLANNVVRGGWRQRAKEVMGRAGPHMLD